MKKGKKPLPELTGRGYEVVLYTGKRRDDRFDLGAGDRREVVPCRTLEEAVTLWRSERDALRTVPTIWYNGNRIPGY